MMSKPLMTTCSTQTEQRWFESHAVDEPIRIMLAIPIGWHGAGSSTQPAQTQSQSSNGEPPVAIESDEQPELVAFRGAFGRGTVHEVYVPVISSWNDVRLAFARKCRRNVNSFVVIYGEQQVDPRAHIPHFSWAYDVDLRSVAVDAREPTPRPRRRRSRSRGPMPRTMSTGVQTDPVSIVDRIEVVMPMAPSHVVLNVAYDQVVNDDGIVTPAAIERALFDGYPTTLEGVHRLCFLDGNYALNPLLEVPEFILRGCLLRAIPQVWQGRTFSAGGQ